MTFTLTEERMAVLSPLEAAGTELGRMAYDLCAKRKGPPTISITQTATHLAICTIACCMRAGIDPVVLNTPDGRDAVALIMEDVAAGRGPTPPEGPRGDGPPFLNVVTAHAMTAIRNRAHNDRLRKGRQR